MSVNPNTYALSESHSHTILVVDDDPANLGVVSDFLKGFDFRILVARDGESALRKAQRGQPDLILLDVMMPGIDGFETCRRLKANEDLRDIPVLFMTALTDAVDKVKGFQAGGMDYITKPFQVEEVSARVQTHLTLHATQEQLTAQNVQLRKEAAERRRAEEALKLSEEKYRTLVENTNDVIFSLDSRGHFSYISPAIERFAHYPLEEVVGQPFVRFVHPDDIPGLQARFEQSLAGEMEPYEFRVFVKDGTLRHVRTSSRPLWEHGQLVGLTGVMVDITERKRAEEALQESEERLRTLINAMPDIVVFKDGEGRYLEVNEFGLNFFQLGNFDYRGRKESELAEVVPLHRNAHMFCETTDNVTWQAQTATRNDEIMPQPDGTLRIFDFIKVPAYYPDGRRKGLVVVGRDVTERKLAEQALQKAHDELEQRVEERTAELAKANAGLKAEISERKRAEEELFNSQQMLRTVLDTVPQRVFWKDRNSVYVGCNKPLARDYGYDDPAMLIGKTDYETASAATADLYRADDQQVMETGQPKLSYEEPQIRPDGSQAWLITSKVPLRDKDGQVIGVLGTSDDITERKHAEKVQETIYRISQAAVSTESLEDFYGSIHRILNELMPVENFYIAVYDPLNDLLSFPYFVDQNDQQTSPGKPDHGLTEYVLRTGRSLLAPPEVFAQLLQQGEVELVGTNSIDWLGVPLKAEERVIGVMVTQSYTEGIRFDQEDADLLEFVSTQVAQTIERKRAEMELRATHQRLLDIIDFLPDATFVIDRDKKVIAWNRAVEEMTGTRKEDIIGQGNYAYAAPFYGERRPIVIDLLGAENSEFKPRYDYVHKQGNTLFAEVFVQSVFGGRGGTLWAMASPLLDSEGNQVGAIESIRDITERKRAEQALRTSEQRYRSLFEDTPLPLWEEDFSQVKEHFESLHTSGVSDLRAYFNNHSEAVVGCAGLIKVLDVNKAAIELVGARDKQELLSGLPEGFTDTSLKAFAEELLILAEGGRQFESEAVYRKISGEEQIVNLHLSVAPGYENSLGKVLISMLDVTERRRAEEELHRRLAELEAVHQISTALRTAQTLDEMLPHLLDETLSVLDTDAGVIWLFEETRQKLHVAVARGWFTHIKETPIKSGEGIAGYVLEKDEPYLSQEFASDPRTLDSARHQVPPGWGGICIPIRSVEETLGVLFVSVQLPRQLISEEVHLLATLAEIAGNAIHRMRLHTQTEKHLQRLTALHELDIAIGDSLDLRLTLNVLLDQVTAHLGVDAADILLLEPYSHTLTYAAGRGFRTNALSPTRLRLGQGLAGRAALERRIIEIQDWRTETNLTNIQLLLHKFQAEGIVAYYGVPLITKGQIKGVLEIFHRSPQSSEPGWSSFLDTLAGQAAIAIDDAQLFESLQRSNLELALAYDTTLEGWSRVLDLRDKETEGHTQRVTETTVLLARAMGLSEAEIVHIRRGALLHDIGKMGIPDGILLKPGTLTEEEWSIMRKHPVYAYEMLYPIKYLHPALDIPYCHHEKWDGSGYPRGLKGEQIPLTARIFAVVDAWDALRSDRPYRAGWPEERVREHIQSLAGTQFDPQIVKICLESGVLSNQKQE